MALRFSTMNTNRFWQVPKTRTEQAAWWPLTSSTDFALPELFEAWSSQLPEPGHWTARVFPFVECQTNVPTSSRVVLLSKMGGAFVVRHFLTVLSRIAEIKVAAFCNPALNNFILLYNLFSLERSLEWRDFIASRHYNEMNWLFTEGSWIA